MVAARRSITGAREKSGLRRTAHRGGLFHLSAEEGILLGLLYAAKFVEVHRPTEPPAEAFRIIQGIFAQTALRGTRFDNGIDLEVLLCAEKALGAAHKAKLLDAAALPNTARFSLIRFAVFPAEAAHEPIALPRNLEGVRPEEGVLLGILFLAKFIEAFDPHLPGGGEAVFAKVRDALRAVRVPGSAFALGVTDSTFEAARRVFLLLQSTKRLGVYLSKRPAIDEQSFTLGLHLLAALSDASPEGTLNFDTDTFSIARLQLVGKIVPGFPTGLTEIAVDTAWQLLKKQEAAGHL